MELENYEDNYENNFNVFFDYNENHKNEEDFLDDSKEKEQIFMNPSFNSTYNSSFNNVPNMPSNISSKNISSNESLNNFSNNDSNEDFEYVACIQDVSIVEQNEKKKKQKKEIKNTNQGRKTKIEAMNCVTKRNKFAKDNIFRKIKTNFFNKFLVDYGNLIIFSFYQKQKYLIRKFNKALVTNVSIQFNLDLFNSPIKNLLNQNNSNKYSTVGLNKNKSILRNLENNSEFNNILNITVNEIYSIFLNDNYKEIISNIFNIDKKEIYFENITGKIIELKEKGDEEEYIENFKRFAYNINELFDKSKKRKSRKPKTDINSNDN